MAAVPHLDTDDIRISGRLQPAVLGDIARRIEERAQRAVADRPALHLIDAFDLPNLSYATHNGGRDLERFPLWGQAVDLGAAVSFLISCRAGVGMTEGLLALGDGVNAVRLTADLATAAVIGLVEHRTLHGQTFCRMMLSALEMDETRRPGLPSPPRRVRYALELASVNAC